MTAYKRAPIVEALIQLQFPEPLSDRELERIAVKAKYPQREEMTDYNVEVKVTSNSAIPGIHATKKWHRMASKDGADVFAVQRDSITVVRHAPYPGWDPLFERFTRDYDLTKSIVGNRRVSRIGVRYINRLDVPNADGKLLDISAYLNVYPRIPNLPIKDIKATHVRFEYQDPNSGLITLLASGNSDPVLLNHSSCFLDIDIIKDKNIPTKGDDVLELLRQMRDVKNEMFESSITNLTRELIDA